MNKLEMGEEDMMMGSSDKELSTSDTQTLI
jgi:hypothetical protein